MRFCTWLSSALLSVCALAAGTSGDPLAPLGGFKKPADAPIRPVVETLWGRKVTDNYRYMEEQKPDTMAWMKAEGAYTRRVLDAIGPLQKLRAEVAKFSAGFGLIQGYTSYGGRSFYQERAPGSDNFDLMVKDGSGTRKIVDVAALRAAHGGTPYAINYFLASPDGAKVAVGVSAGGSEDAVLSIYDAKSGAQVAGPFDRAQFGATAWSDDGKTLYFVRLKKLAANDPPTEKYKDATADAWHLKSEPVAVLGDALGHGPAFTHEEFPAVVIGPGSPLAAALSINGVQNELAIWLTPVAKIDDPKADWKKFVTRDDDVTSMDMRGEEIFLLSHQDAPTFKVLALRAGQPLASAKTLVAASPDRVIEAIHAASDALYVLTHHGAYSQLLRVPAGTDRVEEVPLPVRGHATEVFSDPREPGVTVLVSSWVVPPKLAA
ncbi:MAG: hypothetical protein ACTHL7_04085 [Steroidobacteraceae bacterium]